MIILCYKFGFKKGNFTNHCFKKRSLTHHCSFVMKEAVLYYLNTNNNVFACTLDIHKVFDRVDLFELFNKLPQMPSIITRFIFILYSYLSLHVCRNLACIYKYIAFNGLK